MNNLQETLHSFVVNFQNTQTRTSRNLQHHSSDENYDVSQYPVPSHINQQIIPEATMHPQQNQYISSAILIARPSYNPSSFPNNLLNMNMPPSRRIIAFDPRNVSNPERNVILTQDDISQLVH